MKSYVVDACVLAKVVIEDREEDCDKAQKLFSDFLEGKIKLLVPSFWAFELGNTIRKRLQRLEDQKAALMLLFQAQLTVVHFSESDYLEILGLFDGENITFYDASYYYIAQRKDIPFVTADEKFAKRVKDKKHVVLLNEFIS